MAFFEDLGKKISDGFDGVSNQAKNLSDQVRLSNTISEKEKQVSGLYTAIGQAYFSAHQNDAAPAYGEVEEIKALLEEIRVMKEELNKLKGIPMCANCGAELAVNAAFCPKCGTKVERPNVCPNCGAPKVEGGAFCGSCGAKL